MSVVTKCQLKELYSRKGRLIHSKTFYKIISNLRLPESLGISEREFKNRKNFYGADVLILKSKLSIEPNELTEM